MKTHWASRPITLLAMLALVFTSLVGQAGVANAATYSAKPASINDHAEDCSIAPLSAHFVITQLGATQVPANITVTWSDSTVETVPLDKYTGKTAHYIADDAPGETVVSATADITGSWKGQFNLSHYNCLNVFITIGDSATNFVGDEHEFTITVTGNADLDDVVITWDVTPLPDTADSTCETPDVVDNIATCTLTINSSVVDVYTATASATGTVGGAPFSVDTDGTAFNSNVAVKTYECEELTLFVSLSRPANWGTVTATWAGETATLTTESTEFPFIYTGSITVPGPLESDFWTFTITLGDFTFTSDDQGILDLGDDIFDPEDDTLLPVTIGAQGSDCTEEVSALSPVGDISVRKFNDADGDGADPEYNEFGVPLDEGVADVTIYVCLWFNEACVEGTTQSGVTSEENDFTVQFGSLEAGLWKVWEDAPSGWAQTYPNANSTATDCGGNNTCTADAAGFWLVQLDAAGAVILDVGNVEEPGLCWCSPGFWKNNDAPWALTGLNKNAGFNTTFDVTSIESGVADAVSLQDAAGLTGGTTGKLARFAVAALAIAACDISGDDETICSGSLYGSTETVITAYQQALADGNWDAFTPNVTHPEYVEICPIDANGKLKQPEE